ncbi:MAG: hypothetical protein DRP11_04985 [Candidatus Aenigmatarchaeota archaeon]|nr:MAG: hypothetical protein DRP11_04985 [Candidatus Aenigmarchaeota archaeon]
MEEVVESGTMMLSVNEPVEVCDVPPAPGEGNGQDKALEISSLVPKEIGDKGSEKALKNLWDFSDLKHSRQSPITMLS